MNEDLNGYYIHKLLKNISPVDCEILDVKNPETFLLTCLPVPPVIIIL